MSEPMHPADNRARRSAKRASADLERIRQALAIIRGGNAEPPTADAVIEAQTVLAGIRYRLGGVPYPNQHGDA